MAIPIAYHASHEQFAPSHLLSLVQLAEKAGFDAIHSSDHFHPWSVNQGNSGFAFSWIGAAMQATSIPFSMVCAPGQRYHPAIIAQAIATLSEMFPGRFAIELGSGEALNESITGDQWPEKEKRNQRLLECVTVIRRLLQGEEVSHEGAIKIKQAKLYSLPTHPPLLFATAISADTARLAGSWADGLLTTSGTENEILEKYNAFNQNGGMGKPFHIQFSFSFASSRQKAIDGAYHQWKTNIIDDEKLLNLSTPAEFDKAASGLTKKDIERKVMIVTDMQEIFEHIYFLESLHVSKVILHNVNKDHEEFIATFARYKQS